MTGEGPATAQAAPTGIGGLAARARWWDAALGSLVGATGLIGVAGAMVVTSTSLFLADAVRATPLMIGLFFAGRAASEIATDLVVGVVSDRLRSRRALLALCSVFSAVGALSYLLLRNYYLLFLAGAVFFGIGGATFSQLFAYTREFAESRGHGVAFFNSALRAVTSVAWVVGPPLGLSLIGGPGFGVLFAIAASAYAVSAALCLWGLPVVGRIDATTAAATAAPTTAAPTTAVPTTAAPTTATTAGGRGGLLRRSFDGMNRRAGLLLAAIVVLLTVNIMYQIDVALFVTKDLGFSAGFAGLLLGVASALEVPIMLYLGSRADRIGKWRLVLLATASATVFFALLPLASTKTALLLLQLPNAAWTAVILSIPVVILQDAMPERPGVASALYSSAFKAGAFLGGAIAGVVAAGVGYTNLFWVCAGLTVVAGALLVLGRRP